MCFGVTVMPRVWCLVVVVASALLLSVDLSCADPELRVEYPDRPDYNRVILSCVDVADFDEHITDAVYYRDGTPLSDLVNDPILGVTPVEELEGAIQFTLTQQQEGEFKCGPSGGARSAAVGLAGKD